MKQPLVVPLPRVTPERHLTVRKTRSHYSRQSSTITKIVFRESGKVRKVTKIETWDSIARMATKSGLEASLHGAKLHASVNTQ